MAILLPNHISAVPVVDGAARLVGVIARATLSGAGMA
jgi:CBS domain-containing protein